MLRVFLQYFAVVAIAALVGFSITRVDAGAAEYQISFTLGGALLAVVAILIARVFSGKGSRPFPSIPGRKLAGLKIAVVGFCIALLGWLVSVLVSHIAGFTIAVVGIIVGIAGMAIHFALILRPDE